METRDRIKGHVQQSKDDWWDCLYCPDKQHKGFPYSCPDKIRNKLKPQWRNIENDK